MARSDLVDLEMFLHAETDKAVFVSDTGIRKDAVWIPKSQCEVEIKSGRFSVTVTMSERLATEKGLV